MRFANVNARAALVAGDRYLDLHEASGGEFPAAPGEFLRRWAEFRNLARELQGGTGWKRLDPRSLGAPVPSPGQAIGVGLNYGDHVTESGREVPEFPLVFAKLAGCLSGPFDDLLLPSDFVDWEAELVAVIGEPADRVGPAQAERVIAGLMVGQDFSDRVVQRQVQGGQHTLGKSYRTFGPTGPVLATLDEFDDPFDLEITCTVNGEVVQASRTSHMLIGVGRLISMLSGQLPLSPGDLIFTGTPAGIGSTRTPPRFLRPGDVVQTQIEGLGAIRNTCVADPASDRPSSPDVGGLGEMSVLG